MLPGDGNEVIFDIDNKEGAAIGNTAVFLKKRFMKSTWA
jgi:hypothetical protein